MSGRGSDDTLMQVANLLRPVAEKGGTDFRPTKQESGSSGVAFDADVEKTGVDKPRRNEGRG